jgi:DNA-3-methyladenine glycosylase II
MRFEMMPSGPFSLETSTSYFGGWLGAGDGGSGVAMAFPVEGWQTSAAVVVRQEESGEIVGEVHGAGDEADKAWRQALAVLSLDVDGSGWLEVGRHDPVVRRLQEYSHFLRPVLFHSPYEAAAGLVIGQRISMRQARAVRQAMAEQLGDTVTVGNLRLSAFPRPQALRELASFKGINDEKVKRLHAVAEAALEGLLDRAYLRSLPSEEALSRLKAIHGIGDFTAQGIVYRGAGLADGVTDEPITKQAVQLLYELPETPDQGRVLEIAETWRPYRMWVTVLLHAWVRREVGVRGQTVETKASGRRGRR